MYHTYIYDRPIFEITPRKTSHQVLQRELATISVGKHCTSEAARSLGVLGEHFVY